MQRLGPLRALRGPGKRAEIAPQLPQAALATSWSKHFSARAYRAGYLPPKERAVVARYLVEREARVHVRPAEAGEHHRHVIHFIVAAPGEVAFYLLKICGVFRFVLETAHRPGMHDVRPAQHVVQVRVGGGVFRKIALAASPIRMPAPFR